MTRSLERISVTQISRPFQIGKDGKSQPKLRNKEEKRERGGEKEKEGTGREQQTRWLIHTTGRCRSAGSIMGRVFSYARP